MLFQIAQGLQLRAFVLADPAFVDFMDRDRVKVMEFFAAMPDGGNEVGALEEEEMLGHGLAGHGEVGAQLGERLAIAAMQGIEQVAATRIGEGFEHFVHE